MQTQRIKSIRRIGEMNTLDFRVKSKFHNFYAEGIVVSNSHAIAYSHLTAITTYLKTKYPLEFFLSLLKMARHEPNSLEEIGIIQKELKYFSIELLSPSIRDSEGDFKIENNNIRFGLSAIKGIADAAQKKLITFERNSATKFELFNNCLESKLGLQAVYSLILSGCFPDYNESREKLLLQFQTYNLLTERERILVNRFAETIGNDLFTIIKYLSSALDEKGKVFIKDTRLNTIRKNYQNYKKIYDFNRENGEILGFLQEKEVLGFSYSSSLPKIYNKTYPEVVTLKEAATDLKGSKHTIIGIVKSVKMGKSRVKGTPYISLEIEDGESEVRVMAFSDRIKYFEDENGKSIESDVIVVVKGTTMDENVLFADYAKPLWDVRLAKKINDLK